MPKFDAENTLSVSWSKKEDDFVVKYPSKPTGGYVMDFLFGDRYTRFMKRSAELFGMTYEDKSHWNPDNMAWYKLKSFRQEMEDRGYDLTTLKFSIKKKKNAEDTKKD